MITRSYEGILDSFCRLLEDEFDMREGTVTYMISSAFATELARLYDNLEELYKNAFAATAEGEYLDMAVSVIGLTRNPKSNAVVKMQGDEGFTVGEKLTNGERDYTIIGVEDGYYLARCEEAGDAGNSYLGEVLPKEVRDGFNKMEITAIVALGRDKETDEELRERYIETLNCPVCTGNLSYYKNVLSTIEGVGGVKIEPVPEGVGTVKVIITDENFDKATDELIGYVKETLDPTATSGLGYGLVPIGHKVTVETVEKVDINIQLEVSGKSGNDYYLRLARAYLPDVVRDLNRSWHKKEKIVLRDRVIEDYLFTLNGMEDVNVISINGEQNRLILGENQILGDVTINGV